MARKQPTPSTGDSVPVSMETASLEQLLAFKERAEAQIEKRKAFEINALREKWIKEARAIEMTPEAVLGIEQKMPRAHKTSVFSPVDDDSKEYRKGPYPQWLKALLKKNNKKTVRELVEIGALKTQNPA